MKRPARRRLDRGAVAIVLLAAAGAWLVGLNTYKLWLGFGEGFNDAGLILSAVVNTTDGDPVPMRPADRTDSHLGVHFAPVLFAVSALYRVLPWQPLYVTLMAAAWYGMVLAAGFVAFRLTADRWLGVALAFVLFWNPEARRIFYAGHYEHLLALAELLAMAAWLAGRRGWFLLSVVAGLTVREDSALYAGLFALALAVDARGRRDRWTAAAVALAAFAWFLLAWQVAMPAFRPPGAASMQAWLLQDRWGRGATLPAVVANLLTHPLDLLGAVWRRPVFLLLAGFGFLPLLRPRFALLAVLPPVLCLSLSREADYNLFRYYNASAFLGVLVIAAAAGLAELRHARWLRREWRPVAAWTALAVALVAGAVRHPDAGLQPDLWGFGFTAGGEPFSVDDWDRRAAAALSGYPAGDRSVAAGYRSLAFVRLSPRVSFVNRWRTVRPDVILLDVTRDFPETWRLAGAPSYPAFRAALRAAGYRPTYLDAGCFAYERRPARRAGSGV